MAGGAAEPACRLAEGALTSVLQVVVVLLVLDGQVGLAAQRSQGQQARAGAGHGGEAGGLQAGGVRGQRHRAVGGVGQVLRLELLLLGEGRRKGEEKDQ